MARALEGIEPQKVWRIFEDICQVPRPSKKEEKIIAHIKNWANDHGFEVKEDATGNFVVKKPATPGMESRKTICIQGHVDMVCEKNSDVEFDFDNDPIQCYIDGDWVKAKGTTLGADNGVGVAMGMAILESENIPHPKIELLCTLDEETGLTGAMGLSPQLLEADILINLDSEEDGSFTIGCAGGLNTTGHYKYIANEADVNLEYFDLHIKGFKGGHSGIEIHDERGNAAKFMNRLLWTLTHKYNVRLSSFNSGNKHNAIPREAFATVGVSKAAINDFERFMAEFGKQTQAEYGSKEPNLQVGYDKANKPDRIMDQDFQKKLLNSLYCVPHGVYRMSPDIEGLVQTSMNFAIIETRADEIYMLTSQRSSVESEKRDLANIVQAAIELGGGKVVFGDGYPAWEPNINSPILNRAKEIFVDIFHKEPVIEAIHAGLECGLVGEKYPGMDMLSFGPTLKEVHSPDEKINIPTTQNCWKLLVEIIKNTPEKEEV